MADEAVEILDGEDTSELYGEDDLEMLVEEAAEFIEEHPDKIPAYLNDAILELGEYHKMHDELLHKGIIPPCIRVYRRTLNFREALKEAREFMIEHPQLIIEEGNVPNYYRKATLELGKYHVDHERELHSNFACALGNTFLYTPTTNLNNDGALNNAPALLARVTATMALNNIYH